MVTVQQPTGLPPPFWQNQCPLYNQSCNGLLAWPATTLFPPTPSPSPSPPPSPPVCPLSVDLIKPIGHGSFGVVWSVHNPRTGTRSALKKIPNVFQTLLSCVRTFREIKILSELKHENLLAATDFIRPDDMESFIDICVLSDLMETDLHQIIMSPQKLSEDHINVFVYQILRGVKYLHSANIIHRDLKPGNLLVNSNCLLRICDFGFARAIEPNHKTAMTQEVVTQYYRAPELLAGCKHYDTAIDMWAIGCILAELLGRRILFKAIDKLSQLDMVTDLIGSPSDSDVAFVTSSDTVKSILKKPKPPALHKLYSLSPLASHGIVHLLSQMLIFNPAKRINCTDTLLHPFLEEGRIRYHSFLCNCCYTLNGVRHFCRDMEPSASHKFNQKYEKDITSTSTAKLLMFAYISSVNAQQPPLQINTFSKQYHHFENSTPGIPPSSSQI